MNDFSNPDLIAASAAALDNVNTPTRSEHHDWQPVVPFKQELPQVHPFDLTLLPDSIGPWIQDICKRMDSAPIDFASVASMVALGSLIGRKVALCPKQHTDWRVVPNLWGALIGRPSTKKTPVINEILAPIQAFEKAAKIDFEQEQVEYKSDRLLDELTEKDATSKAKSLIKKKQAR